MPKIKVDFSDTESRGGKKGRGGRKHYPPGDYAVKCTRAEVTKSSEKETPGIAVTFKITRGKFKGQDVNDSIWISPKSLWRLRQTLEAMGVKVPSKAVNIDTNVMKGKELAITLDDEEYDNKVYSRVVDTFLLSELEATEEDEGEDTDVESDEEDEDEVADVESPVDEDEDELEGIDLDL